VFLKHLVPPSVSCKWEHTNEARKKPNDVYQYSQPCPAQFHGCGLPYPCHMQFATRQLSYLQHQNQFLGFILWVPELVKPEKERHNNECPGWDDSYEALKCTPLLPPVITI
jgi:hypothetical protein